MLLPLTILELLNESLPCNKPDELAHFKTWVYQDIDQFIEPKRAHKFTRFRTHGFFRVTKLGKMLPWLDSSNIEDLYYLCLQAKLADHHPPIICRLMELSSFKAVFDCLSASALSSQGHFELLRRVSSYFPACYKRSYGETVILPPDFRQQLIEYLKKMLQHDSASRRVQALAILGDACAHEALEEIAKLLNDQTLIEKRDWDELSTAFTVEVTGDDFDLEPVSNIARWAIFEINRPSVTLYGKSLACDDSPEAEQTEPESQDKPFENENDLIACWVHLKRENLLSDSNIHLLLERSVNSENIDRLLPLIHPQNKYANTLLKFYLKHCTPAQYIQLEHQLKSKSWGPRNPFNRIKKMQGEMYSQWRSPMGQYNKYTKIVNELGQKTQTRFTMERLDEKQIVHERHYDEKGFLELDIPYQDGLKHGNVCTYTQGRLISVEPYEQGLPHGKALQFSLYTGKCVGSYTMNQGTGMDLWWSYDDKQTPFLSEVHSFKEGAPHGTEWWLNPDGTLWHERHWKQGQHHGIERMWNDEGKLCRGFPRYYVNNVRKTKRQYLKACLRDATLPQYLEKDHQPQRDTGSVISSNNE